MDFCSDNPSGALKHEHEITYSIGLKKNPRLDPSLYTIVKEYINI
jgi:hypothetical protein